MALHRDHTDKDIVEYALACFREAEDAKREREELNELNHDSYHMRHDFSHKEEGQSVETFSKPRMAVEQTKSFFQQSLADMTDGWFDTTLRDFNTPDQALLIKPWEVKKLLNYYLTRGHYYNHVGASVQRGLLESAMITKIGGKLCPLPRFEVKGKTRADKRVVKVEDKTWELTFSRVRAKDFFPDPTGNKLYEAEIMWQDLHKVKSDAKMGMYDTEAVNQLSTASQEDGERSNDRYRETNQTDSTHDRGHRPQVKLLEFWGDIISADGELLYENIVMTIANDKHLIRKPTPNPLWHQRSPYTMTPLIDVDGAVWPIALMDAPVKHNHAFTELFNLALDGAFKHVQAISQIRIQDLANKEQVANGIKPGTKLQVKSSLPVGGKVMEALEDTNVPTDAMNMLNLLQQEFNSSALTNDLRQGVLPDRSVKATEVVEASNTINSIFKGLTKNIEASHIPNELELATMTIAQSWDQIAKETFISLFGPDRGAELFRLDPQDVFTSIASGFKYEVFGITQTLAKAQDFQKITTALQTIGNVPFFQEPFMAKYDPKKILDELLKALSINTEKLKLSEKQLQMNQQPSQGPATEPGTAPSEAPSPVTQAPSALAQIFGAGEASNGFNGSA